MLRKPAIHNHLLAFTAQSNLWVADRDGTNPRRLTTQIRVETDAAFSPDGQWLAFTGQHEGGPQVYRIPVEGGEPERLTHDQNGSFCLGWLPNDAGVLIRSSRAHPQKRSRIYSVPAEGGVPTPLPLPEAEFAAVHPDGRIVFVPTSADAIPRRGYRGGKMDTLWLYQEAQFHALTDGSFIATTPFWLGNDLYFIGDRDETGVSRLYRFDWETQSAHPVEGCPTGIAYPKTDGETVVFERGDELVTWEPRSGTATPLRISPPYDPQPFSRRQQPVTQFLAGQELELLSAPRHAIDRGGERLLLEFRGQILELSESSGTAETRLYRPGSRCRYPSPSPSGAEFAVVADLPFGPEPAGTAEQRLWLCNDSGPLRPLTPVLRYFPEQPVWSPDGRWIALGDRALRILLVDTQGGEGAEYRVVEQGRRSFTSAGVNASYCFSPDGKWLAYSNRGDNWLGVICLYELATQRRYALTTPEIHTDSPTFSSEGKWLYFRAATGFYREPSGLCFLDGLNVSATLYRIPLKKLLAALPSRTPGATSPASDTPPTDVSGLALPLLETISLDRRVRPRQILAAREHLLVVNEQPHPGESSSTDLYAYPMPESSEARLAAPLWIIPEVDSLQLSPQGDALLLQTGGDLQRVRLNRSHLGVGGETRKVLVEDSYGSRLVHVLAPGGPRPVDLQRAVLEIDPRAEWRQMLWEAWRLARDVFWNPYYNGVDWPGIWRQYEHRLDQVTDRLELNDLLTQLLAELKASHVSVSGGDVDGFGAGLNIGYLGADLVPAPAGDCWQIQRILRHDPYQPRSRSPLREAGIQEGMYIHRVNGRAASHAVDFNQLMLNCGNRQVNLEVSTAPTPTTSLQTYQLRALKSEAELRYQDWVERQRERVLQQAGPAVGYVPVRNMLLSGLLDFARYYFPQLHCRALILDVRNNEGGNISNTLLMHLSAKFDAFLHSPFGGSYPRANHGFGGKLLVLCDETTVSNAEEFCQGVKTLGVGRLVGRRTFGAGVSPIRYSLLDQGQIKVPNVGIWSPTGDWIVETEGVTPSVPVAYCPAKELQGDALLEAAIQELDAGEKEVERSGNQRRLGYAGDVIGPKHLYDQVEPPPAMPPMPHLLDDHPRFPGQPDYGK
jgi:tricorn protease